MQKSFMEKHKKGTTINLRTLQAHVSSNTKNTLPYNIQYSFHFIPDFFLINSISKFFHAELPFQNSGVKCRHLSTKRTFQNNLRKPMESFFIFRLEHSNSLCGFPVGSQMQVFHQNNKKHSAEIKSYQRHRNQRRSEILKITQRIEKVSINKNDV